VQIAGKRKLLLPDMAAGFLIQLPVLPSGLNGLPTF
jgi:hypothetical protein